MSRGRGYFYSSSSSHHPISLVDLIIDVAPKHISFYSPQSEQCTSFRSLLKSSHMPSSTSSLSENPPMFVSDISSILSFSSFDFRQQCLLEIGRRSLVNSSRNHYEELCYKIPIDVPKESFNRWILERSTRTYSVDPKVNIRKCLIPPPLVEPIVGSSLRREIMEDLPFKVDMWPSKVIDAIDSHRLFVEHGEELLFRQSSRGEIKDAADELKTILHDIYDEAEFYQQNISNETVRGVLSYLKEQKARCRPLFDIIMDEPVSKLCIDLAYFLQ